MMCTSRCSALMTKDGSTVRSEFAYNVPRKKPIGGRVDRASATDAVDSGSIPGRVKPKTIKIGIHSFTA